MSNLTISVDDQLIKQARIRAIHEGTSLSALESMACQTAVIATNIGGLNDLPCILTNPNPKSLAQTMIENFKNREQIAQEQFNITTKIYNLDNWRRAWLKAIAYD